MSTHTDDSALVEVFSSVFTHVRDVARKLLHTALGLAHLESVFIYVDRSEDILANHALVEHDSVLIVISLPGHVSHLQVAADGKLSVLGRVAFGENVALLHTLTLVANRAKVDGGALVGLAELRQAILFHCVFEAYKLLVGSAVVAHANHVGIDVFYNTCALCLNLGA